VAQQHLGAIWNSGSCRYPRSADATGRQSAGGMGCGASVQTKVSQPEEPSAAEVEAKRLAEVARLEQLVAETGGAPEPSPVRQQARPRRTTSRADKMAARAVEAKQKKAASLQGQVTIASKLVALRKQARKNIEAQNKQLAQMAPAEISSDSEDDEQNPSVQSEDSQPVRTDPDIETTAVTEQSHNGLAGGDSLRAAEVEPSTA
jgi:hypothetical protein